jgi:hypothetical protein
MHGRVIRVSLFEGHPRESIYVVAEPDHSKAISLLRSRLGENYDEYEDLGRVSADLLAVLNLAPGEYKRT